MHAVVAILVFLGLLGADLSGGLAVPQTAPQRPNFVVIMADDLDSGSMKHMPAVNRLLGERGATFQRFFATTPLCCPARASILRGQYAHNHGVLRNTGQDAGFGAFHDADLEESTVATSLDAAGYETALIGKYLNGYTRSGEGRTYVPPGWDFWAAGIDHQAYASFNYDLNVNGEVVSFGRSEDNYMTDVLAGLAHGFLDDAQDSPFFLFLAPYAPHSPSRPAPRHRGEFSGESIPRTPSFNERNVRDKPKWVRASPPLSDARIKSLGAGYRDRLASLQAVDEMVESIVAKLEAQGVLDSTYILFLSDNGYFLGEHRQPRGKDAPYDAAARVPLVMRGPGIAAGSTIDRIALNIDLMPTLLDLSGTPIPAYVDGRSLAPLWSGNGVNWRAGALLEGFGKEIESLEAGGVVTPAFRALRQEDLLYVEYETGERELYDLRRDPFELKNRVKAVPNKRLRQISAQLNALATCSAAECRRLEDEALAQPRQSADRRHDRHDRRRNHHQRQREREKSRKHHQERRRHEFGAN